MYIHRQFCFCICTRTTCTTHTCKPTHTYVQVNETETAKRESEAEHMRLTAALQHVMERYRITEIKLRKDIKKAQ